MINCNRYGKNLSRLTAKWRLILLVLVSSLSFMVYDWRFYLANLAITFLLVYLTNTTQIYKKLGLSFYLFILIFGIHGIWGDWVDGVKVILRFYNILIFASWALWTTSLSAIIEGLGSLLHPLSYLGLKPAKIGLAFTLAIRFMPLIFDTLKEVKIAQQARGIDKRLLAILLSAIIKIIKMADHIAEAIESRSWEG